MPRRTRPRSASPRDQVTEILAAEPPLDRAGVARRLRGVDGGELWRALAALVRDGAADWDHAETLGHVAALAGADREHGALRGVLFDDSLDEGRRALALSVLAGCDAVDADDVARRLGPELAARLALMPVLEAFTHGERDLEATALVVETLVGAPPPVRPNLIALLGQRRVAAAMPVATAYRAILAEPRLADLRAPILTRVVDEDPPSSRLVLTTLRDRAADENARRDFQAASMRLGTRAVERAAETAVRARAFVTSCDGQGAFVVLGRFEQPDGGITIADLCIRADADLRDGFVIVGASAADSDALWREMEGGIGALVEAPLDEVAELVARAVERTESMERALPDDAVPAILRFARVPRPVSATTNPTKRPELPSLAETRKLLGRAMFESWFLDKGDLRGAGIELPRRKKPSAKWTRDALAMLAASEIRGRLAAMAEHMARWHRWRGDASNAERFAALAEVTARDLPSSPLARAILERSLAIIDADEDPGLMPFGDPILRDDLRRRFFVAVDKPRGRDLGRLDLAEAAFLALDRALQELPGHQRPRDDDAKQVAWMIATAFADRLLDEKDLATSRKSLERAAARLAAAATIPDDRARDLVGAVTTALAGFVDQVCGDCPVRCIERPAADVARAFFADEHPASK